MAYTNEEILEAIDVLKSAKQHECRVGDTTIDLCVDILERLLSWSSYEKE